MSGADVNAALPRGVTLQLLGSEGGKVMVRATGALFGFGASLDAVAEASGGQIVVHPAGPLLGGVRLTLYSDPRVYVLGVSAEPSGRPAELPRGPHRAAALSTRLRQRRERRHVPDRRSWRRRASARPPAG